MASDLRPTVELLTMQTSLNTLERAAFSRVLSDFVDNSSEILDELGAFVLSSSPSHISKHRQIIMGVLKSRLENVCAEIGRMSSFHVSEGTKALIWTNSESMGDIEEDEGAIKASMMNAREDAHEIENTFANAVDDERVIANLEEENIELMEQLSQEGEDAVAVAKAVEDIKRLTSAFTQ